MANAAEHAAAGCGYLQREATSLAVALDELERTTTEMLKHALEQSIAALMSGADSAEKAAGEFRRASALVTENSDAEGTRIAIRATQTGDRLHEIRRETAAIITRLEEIARLIGAFKQQIKVSGHTVMAVKEDGEAYARRLAA